MPPAACFGCAGWRRVSPTVCFECAEGAVEFGAPSPPLRGPYLFCAGMARDASGGPFFSVLPEKNGEKRGAGREIALTRLKSLSFCFAFSRYTVLRPNALRAAVQSVFPIARHAVRVVSFAPVEYLAYGSRKAVLLQGRPRISRVNILPRKVHSKQTQSISITSPVYPIRICIAFCKS